MRRESMYNSNNKNRVDFFALSSFIMAILTKKKKKMTKMDRVCIYAEESWKKAG